MKFCILDQAIHRYTLKFLFFVIYTEKEETKRTLFFENFMLDKNILYINKLNSLINRKQINEDDDCASYLKKCNIKSSFFIDE